MLVFVVYLWKIKNKTISPIGDNYYSPKLIHLIYEN